MSHRLYGGAICGLPAAMGIGLVLAWILPSGVSFAQGETKDAVTGGAVQAGISIDPAVAADWMRRWKQNILSDSRTRYCDKEMGEEIGWLVSPFLNAYYYGYMATGDREWVDRLIDWGDSVIKRGVKEPDGYIGWPRAGGAAATGAIKEDYFNGRQAGRGDVLSPPWC